MSKADDELEVALKNAAPTIRIAFLLLGSLLFLYLLLQLRVDEVFSLVAQVGWSACLIVLVYGVYQLVRASALLLCVPGGHRPSYWDVLQIRISGEAVSSLPFTGPVLAEPSKAWLLKKHGLTTEEAIAATLAETLIQSFTWAAIIIVGLGWLASQFQLPGPVLAATVAAVGLLALFLVVSAVAVAFRIYPIGAIVAAVARLPLVRSRLHPNMERVQHTEDLLLLVLRGQPGRLVAIIGAELVGHSLLVLELFLILKSMGLSLPVLHLLSIEAAAKLARLAFFFIPTQIGAAEAAYVAVFNTLGLAAAAGFAVSFVRRLRSLLATGLGLICFWLRTAER